MLRTLTLLLPALIPSWRFFDGIAPSPRIEFRLAKTGEDASGDWREFRPRPARLPPGSMFTRLFSNPRWNESLFLVSCAERFTEQATEHSSQEIINRIRKELGRHCPDFAASPWLQFRLAFLSREGAQMQKHIAYVSPLYPSSAPPDL